jgi:cold shock CspA family protein
MKSLSEIEFGFSDAENYRQKDKKDLFNKIFLKTSALDQLTKGNIFFLVGEKGTGKTAYAVHMSSSQYKDNVAIHKFIRETDYQKFISLKRDKHLTVSDYQDIWKVIIYLLISNSVESKDIDAGWFSKNSAFGNIKSVISEYYSNAFSPEIPVALQFVEDSKVAAELLAKHLVVEGKMTGEMSASLTSNSTKFQTQLLFLEKHFQAALESLKLSSNRILFIDGIDIRPPSIPYDEYLDCVKGLANAVWSINSDFFPNIKDSPGRMRVVLLLRPDIFNSLGLQNRNTKLKDNSIILNWNTKYPDHRQSELFAMSDRLFAAQQAEKGLPVGLAWDNYFPFNAESVHDGGSQRTSFVALLRYSYHRPRDILAMLDILDDLYVKNGTRKSSFILNDVSNSEFRKAFSTYFLGEIKDSLAFYYSDEQFESFLKFFQFLEGRNKFNYEQYLSAYVEYVKFLSSQGKEVPAFMSTPEEWLQFLYDQNVLGYIEDSFDSETRFVRWCFIERTVTNISPQVKSGLEYQIHYGLAAALNVGKPLKTRLERKVAPPTDRHPEGIAGTVKFFDPKKKYGFIVCENIPIDIHFREKAVVGKISNGARVQVVLGKLEDGRLEAVRVRAVSEG